MGIALPGVAWVLAGLALVLQIWPAQQLGAHRLIIALGIWLIHLTTFGPIPLIFRSWRVIHFQFDYFFFLFTVVPFFLTLTMFLYIHKKK